MNESEVRPCWILGISIGRMLTEPGVMGWLKFVSLPVAASRIDDVDRR
jgi:hypothetical protein